MRYFTAGLILALMTAVPTLAQDQDWKVTCNDSDRCTALLVVADAATKRTLASVGLQIGRGGTEPVMIALLPLGVDLRPGFRAVIGDKAFDAPYEVCFPDGCRAIAPIATDDLDLWLDADSISLRFFPSGSDKPVAADTPVKGLRSALADHLAKAP